MGFGTRDTDCNLCNSASLEDDKHLFCQCPWSKEIWMKVQQWLGISLPPKGVKDMLHCNLLHMADSNQVIFMKAKANSRFIIQQIKHIIRERVLNIQNARFRSKCIELIERICN
ncbi:hypothetical protein R3W88_007752 [Solanum pinnatisectum]|uniref:Reverse transcriptase zinc-binding domain-containing protein n=1 Tax=Solanum pinnatisectum TaxID=50273 RepID=A0AAV9M6A2_9SOLN|nr:hypothetical protein R3W88_007752 [Solanum pinnatisectum]